MSKSTLVTRADWHAPGELELTPILRAAREAFASKGYHATSVREIAARVGVTVPALYYHHENKEAILYTLLDASITRLRRLCEDAMADSDGSPEERFLNFVECIVIYEANAGESAVLDNEIRSLSPLLRKSYSEKRRVIETMLVDVIADGVATSVFEVASPSDTARALVGMYQAIPRWFHADGRLTAIALAQQYKDISAHAVGAVPAVIARAGA